MHGEAQNLKDYALALYARQGVSAACLLLQESTGLDVNVLLFAAWVGVTRFRAVGPKEIEEAQARVASWHREVVRPLRTVRRRLKTGPAPAPSEKTAKLREDLQRLEICAEVIELEELGALGAQLAAEPAGAPGDMAAAGMLAVAEAAAGRPLETEEKDAVGLIARAAGMLPE